MAKASASEKLAREYAKQARAALIKHDLPAAVEHRRVRQNGLELWQAAEAADIVIPKFVGIGRWYLKMSWDIYADPARDSARLLTGSMSLNVSDTALTSGLSTECLVRYDIDLRATSPTAKYAAAHLNVLQPGPLEDRVHYPVVGGNLFDWPVAGVIDFLVSPELENDLRSRLK